MQLLDIKCPSCGGMISNKMRGRVITCDYCGSRFVLEGSESEAFAADVTEAFEDEELSNLSMTEFAKEVCSGFLLTTDEGKFKNTPKVLKGLGINSGEEVYLIHDDTLFKNGKDGFAVTEAGLYCREMGEQSVFTDWATFAKLPAPEIKNDKEHYVVCGKRSVVYFTDNNEILEDLLNLYKRLHNHARSCA